MKHYSKWLYSAMAIGMLASCSNDDIIDDNNPVNDGEGVYMHLNIIPSVGNGTRSTTNGDDSSTEGIETPTEIENNVSEVLLILANKTADGNYSFIADATISNDKLDPITSGANKGYASTGKFTKAEIEAYYKSPNFSQKVCVFVFCNPTTDLTTKVAALKLGDTNWVNETYKLTSATDGSIWSTAGNGHFLMSNYRIAERELPATFSAWNPYTVETNPFDLSGMNSEGTANQVDNVTDRGVVYVHRAAARFDFKDGSNNNNTYSVVFARNADGSQGEALVNVQLTDMAMVNLGNACYYLERTSADGQNSIAGLCAPERPWTFTANGDAVANSGNYVVDVYATAKKTGISSDFGSYFYYPFFDASNNPAPGQWASYKIADVLKGASDNYGAKEYKVWRYATENTIPEVAEQINGQSTGVVFTGKMIATAACNSSTDAGRKALYEAINNVGGILEGAEAPVLIQFRGNLYAGMQNLYDAAVAASMSINGTNVEWSRSNSLYRLLFGNGGTGKTVTLVEAGEGQDQVTYTDPLAVDPNSVWGLWLAKGNYKAALVKNTATLYEASNGSEGWGYYCNYYYWNRHNDNNFNGVMGPMEFSVVRNNVYKLAVTKLGQLGHPLIPTNDPDKPKPDTPDEQPDVYMTVTCEVVPWVVRINSIEF